MLRIAIPLLLLTVLAGGRAAAQSAADSAAIRQAALDYIEGYYTADGARMERAVHPELAKRIVRRSSAGDAFVANMGATALVAGTRANGAEEIPPADRRTEVAILDIFQNSASARIDAGPWIDYLHLSRIEGRWVIVNVLWELRAPAGGR